MTTATGGTADDDEVLTTEVEPERRKASGMAPGTTRAIFLSLAGVAALALLSALVAVAMSSQLSPAAFRTWLFSALGVLVIVVIAEIVLLLVARPRTA